MATPLQTVQKAGQALGLFSSARPEWGVSEMARVLELPKSSVSELLTSLADTGLLRRTDSGRYRIGWRLFELSQGMLESTDFRTEANPVMTALVERFGATSHLAIIEEGSVVYVEKQRSGRALPIGVSRVGSRLPAHATAVGKVLLAFLSWSRVAAILASQGMPALTSRTITCPERLAAELREVRAQGYALDLEEAMGGLSCIAAPIRNIDGEVAAAVSISVETAAFTPQRTALIAGVTGAATTISARLGYRPPHPSAQPLTMVRI